MFSQLTLLDFHSLNCPQCYFAHNLCLISKHKGDGDFLSNLHQSFPKLTKNIGKSFKIDQKYQKILQIIEKFGLRKQKQYIVTYCCRNRMEGDLIQYTGQKTVLHITPENCNRSLFCKKNVLNTSLYLTYQTLTSLLSSS